MSMMTRWVASLNWVMYMEIFNILAQSLEHNEVNLVIVANTGRSGSTLLAQMFESIKGKQVDITQSVTHDMFVLGTKVLSEPHTLLDAMYLYNNNVFDDQ